MNRTEPQLQPHHQLVVEFQLASPAVNLIKSTKIDSWKKKQSQFGQFNSIQLPQQQQQRVQMQSSKFKARSSKVHSNSKSAVGSGQLNGSWQVFFSGENWQENAGWSWPSPHEVAVASCKSKFESLKQKNSSHKALLKNLAARVS